MLTNGMTERIDNAGLNPAFLNMNQNGKTVVVANTPKMMAISNHSWRPGMPNAKIVEFIWERYVISYS